jgi:PAS domain S-box-containing protein
MKALDSRAIENIASAPATVWDRRSAIVTLAAILALVLISLPFGRIQLDQIASFLPTVVGAAIVSLVLSAALLYVQYRVARDPRLGLLAIAYGFVAIMQLLYLLVFPNTFVPGQLLGAGPNAAATFYILSQFGFAVLVIGQAIVGRAGIRISRPGIRVIGVVCLLIVIVVALAATAGHAAFVPMAINGANAPILTFVVAPLLTILNVCAAIAAGANFRSVTEVWLAVVLGARALAVFSVGEIATARYTVAWYSARVIELLAALIMLMVFLVKLNELILRLAERNRSTTEALLVGEARYASLANVVPQLIWTTNTKGEFEFVNDRFVDYTGCDLNAVRDGLWRDVLYPEDAAMVRERWSWCLSSGANFAAEFRLRSSDGRYRWFLGNGIPARGADGEIVAWIATCTDVDLQKRQDERDAFLARSSERLGASLNVMATVESIESLLGGRLSSLVRVALVDEGGRYAVNGLPLPTPVYDLVTHAVRVAEPLVVDAGVQLREALFGGAPVGVAVLVPLVHAEVPIGVLALARDAPPFDLEDIALLRDFGRRAALALDHARIYERERTTADALQRAMLPAQLPQLPHLRFSASYSAASESQRVGGDFYDAFVMPDGRVALTIGDVTGHGLEAAVIMGEIRQALRAAAFESAEPSTILDRASRLLVASGRTVFVTAIFGILDPISGVFAYASAGHPAPLLDDGHQLQRLATAGLPIGLRDGEGVDFALRLQAPTTLVMFTDGLMEFARDLDEGERRIEAALRALALENVEHLATVLMKDVLGDDVPTDDIAILTLQITRFIDPLPHDFREWRFASSDALTAAMVRRELGRLVATWTQRPDLTLATEVVFGELIANAVRHAPGPVIVEATRATNGTATLTVDDSGIGFTPLSRRTDPYAESGRGLELVRTISDAVTITRSPHGGTRVSVSFHINPLALTRTL